MPNARGIEMSDLRLLFSRCSLGTEMPPEIEMKNQKLAEFQVFPQRERYTV